MISLRELYDASPKLLKLILMSNWEAKQNPNYHPEGNSLKHIFIVTKRAIAIGDINLILSAYFHDLGKYETFDISEKTGFPTAYDHELVSVRLVRTFRDFIFSMGGEPHIIEYIVSNHMLIKSNVWDIMKDRKKKMIMNSRYFHLLEKFGTIDKGGY